MTDLAFFIASFIFWAILYLIPFPTTITIKIVKTLQIPFDLSSPSVGKWSER